MPFLVKIARNVNLNWPYEKIIEKKLVDLQISNFFGSICKKIRSIDHFDRLAHLID